MWWKILIFLVMTGVIIAAYITPAPQQQIGEASRVFYFHIPQAWLCVVAFTVSMVFSIRYLAGKKAAEDDKALVAASVGFVFCVLATITGSMFAKVTWGSFWNWDPRETSIVLVLLIYGAYFALRNSIEVEEKRATLAAVYSIFAFAAMLFLIIIVPRIMPSLHPEDSIVDSNMKFQMTTPVASVFFSSLAVFTALFVWIFDLGRRVARVKRNRESQEL